MAKKLSAKEIDVIVNKIVEEIESSRAKISASKKAKDAFDEFVEIKKRIKYLETKQEALKKIVSKEKCYITYGKPRLKPTSISISHSSIRSDIILAQLKDSGVDVGKLISTLVKKYSK